MADSPARLALHTLSLAAVERVRESGLSIDRFRGIAYYDAAKDESQLVADVEPLRHLVRALLRGFIHLALTPGHGYGKQFFQERLDAALQDEAECNRLRAALGIA